MNAALFRRTVTALLLAIAASGPVMGVATGRAHAQTAEDRGFVQVAGVISEVSLSDHTIVVRATARPITITVEDAATVQWSAQPDADLSDLQPGMRVLVTGPNVGAGTVHAWQIVVVGHN